MCGPEPTAPRRSMAGGDGMTTSHTGVPVPAVRIGQYVTYFAECPQHAWRGPFRYSTHHAEADASIHERTYHDET